MKIEVTRNSVCAGDDIDAPHTIWIEVHPDDTLRDVIALIIEGRRPPYLASISGGEATWVAVSDEPLAVVCQQPMGPYFLFDATTLASEIFSGQTSRFHFEYLVQLDPVFVLQQLVEM